MQSFDDGKLKALGRIHDGAEARRAIDAARDAGFGNLNLDLMFGLPGDRPGDGVIDLEQALAFAPEHISWYQLTIEEGTAFARKPPPLPGHDQICDDYECGVERLAQGGFVQYEISAYARSGREARHNLNYWNRGEYLGAGAGAHSLIRGRRFWNLARPDHYAEKADDPTAGEEDVSGAEKALGESLMLGLRLREGVSLGDIARECGGEPEEIFGGIFSALADQGLIERENKTVRLSRRGTLLANQVLAKFL